MTRPRSEQILPGQPGFYHCISRCVRRSRLCGFDSETGRDYGHRRDWIVERMRHLTSSFAIDVYAYAVMSNHSHIVLYVDPGRLESIPDEEIIIRWKRLWNWRHPGLPLKIPSHESAEKLATWRKRLADVSWFMRMLNEPIARIANAEDGCKGHFWESRFKSLPLLDNAAVIACMSYVDLNPIKAGVAQTVEQSDFTSVQARMLDLISEPSATDALGPVFVKDTTVLHDENDRLGVSTRSYLELVDITANGLAHGAIGIGHPLLMQLGLRTAGWMLSVNSFLSLFRTAAGSVEQFHQFMAATNRVRMTDRPGRHDIFDP